MVNPISYRFYNLILFLACGSLLASGFVIEYSYFLPPCPLCTLQRVCYLLSGLIFFLAFIHNPKQTGKVTYLVTALIIIIAGLYVASYQVWLQFFHTGEALSCSQGLFDILESNRLLEVFKILFSPNVECGDASFRLFGLTIAQWSFIAFGGLTIINFTGIILLLKRKWGQEAPLKA